jgi:hypothetical protein
MWNKISNWWFRRKLIRAFTRWCGDVGSVEAAQNFLDEKGYPWRTDGKKLIYSLDTGPFHDTEVILDYEGASIELYIKPKGKT